LNDRPVNLTKLRSAAGQWPPVNAMNASKCS
jgi:hypothetical protein